MEASLMYYPTDFIGAFILMIEAIVDALIQEVIMNLLNVIATLDNIKSKMDIIYENTQSKNANDKYMSSLKDETSESISNLINDLRSVHKERIGLEVNAWRM